MTRTQERCKHFIGEHISDLTNSMLQLETLTPKLVEHRIIPQAYGIPEHHSVSSVTADIVRAELSRNITNFWKDIDLNPEGFETSWEWLMLYGEDYSYTFYPKSVEISNPSYIKLLCEDSHGEWCKLNRIEHPTTYNIRRLMFWLKNPPTLIYPVLIPFLTTNKILFEQTGHVLNVLDFETFKTIHEELVMYGGSSAPMFSFLYTKCLTSGKSPAELTTA